jgi:PHD/YefM family antitoxin component YafN of YafNO toxin-antitoxin module
VLKIKKQYLVNEQNEPVAVLLDLKTFEKIEELLEDRLLARCLDEVADEEPLTLHEARKRRAQS